MNWLWYKQKRNFYWPMSWNNSEGITLTTDLSIGQMNWLRLRFQLMFSSKKREIVFWIKTKKPETKIIRFFYFRFWTIFYMKSTILIDRDILTYKCMISIFLNKKNHHMYLHTHTKALLRQLTLLAFQNNQLN